MSEVETALEPTETSDAGSIANAGVTDPPSTETNAEADAGNSAAESAASAGGSGDPTNLQPATQPNPATTAKSIDIAAEQSAIDELNTKLKRGDIGYEDHAIAVAEHNKKITAATMAAVEPVTQTLAQAEHNRRYWSNWGKGQDVAQMQFGKSVNAKTAQQLFDQAEKSVAANPRYANRPELNNETIIYDKWMDLMEAESKKKPGGGTTSGNAPTQTHASTRVSGNSATATGADRAMTAREKLDAGMYDGELKSGKFG